MAQAAGGSVVVVGPVVVVEPPQAQGPSGPGDPGLAVGVDLGQVNDSLSSRGSPLTVAVMVTVSPFWIDVIPLESALTTVDESTAYTWTYPSALVTVIEPALTDPAVPYWVSIVSKRRSALCACSSRELPRQVRTNRRGC